MCGIVGLLMKNKSLRDRLGELMVPMFSCMAARGSDSGGCAFFGDPEDPPRRRFSLHVSDRQDPWQVLMDAYQSEFGGTNGSRAEFQTLENHAVLISGDDPVAVRDWLEQRDPKVHLMSVGRSIDVYKDAGDPIEICKRFRFAEATGSHCVGHTRMATESAVTPVHSHPYTAGEDFCLVHNGSLSNPYMLRRRLERKGIRFETDNDTEAACRFLEWRLCEGDDLPTALTTGFAQLDGFYTLLMATGDQVCLVRDAFACKPAVVAETDEYVAISSEFRSLAHLPGVADAEIFEPKPEEIYSWRV
jgi:glutamate synthase domain-containing protein 1